MNIQQLLESNRFSALPNDLLNSTRTRNDATKRRIGPRPSLFERSSLLMASHLIDGDGLFFCGSSTRIMATSVTDTRPIMALLGLSHHSSPVHVYVDDDPRKWSHKLKVSLLLYHFTDLGSAHAHHPSASLCLAWIGEYTVHGLLCFDGCWPQ